ncbi:hypothetical protein LINGRAHAP2_LOCUS3135 [Linum grandiflorum]
MTRINREMVQIFFPTSA